ncbi:unnamed protein product, partial [Cyprideis torosa]
MPFQALISDLLPGAFSAHPDFAEIEWDKVEWSLDQIPFTPDVGASLKDNGVGHKSVIRMRTPGLNGIAGGFVSYEVTIEPLGATIEVEDGQTILDAALRAGVWLPHACCHGLCATCKVQVVEGEVEQGDASPFALMDFERDEGKCLACCAIPESDLVIEADVEEDPDGLNQP